MIKQGVTIAFAVGIAAYVLNLLLDQQEVFSPGASSMALVLGAIVAMFATSIESGGKWLIKQILPAAIILLGFGLNLTLFTSENIGLVGIAAGLCAAITSLLICFLLGKAMGLDLETSIALGAGGAICGNSAVIAVAPGLRLKEESIAVVLAIINLLGLATFVVVPLLSNLLDLPEITGGIWAGASVHAVPQAVAAGEAVGPEGMLYATAVKLARVTLLILVVPLCTLIGNRIHTEDSIGRQALNVPYFVPGFVLAAILSTWILPSPVTEPLVQAGRLLMLPLLAAVGFFINRESMKAAGGPVLIVGTVATIGLMASSYLVLATLT